MDAPRPTGTIAAMIRPRHAMLVAAALAAGCAGAPSRPGGAAAPRAAAEPPAHASDPAAARRAVETARALAGHREIVVGGVSYGDGCSALVRAAYQQAGLRLPAGATDVKALHAFARSEGSLRRTRPAPGDLVFLSDRPGGQVEHVGLVEKVGPGGTVTALHRTGRGVVRLRVNGGEPWKARGDDGQILNDVLVVGGGRVSAGRLLVAYATLL
jgi:cell wall-associated NlpC family hydrolase